MDPREEMEWRRRVDDNFAKLFGIVTDIRITCAGRNSCGPNDQQGEQAGAVRGEEDSINAREKFLLSMLTLAVAVIGILMGKVVL